MVAITKDHDGNYCFFTIQLISVETWLGWQNLPYNGGNANGGQLPGGIYFAFNDDDPLYAAIMEWDYATYPQWQPVVGTCGNMTGLEPRA